MDETASYSLPMHSGASSRFLIGVAAVLATAGLLAGCSGSDDEGGSGSDGGRPSSTVVASDADVVLAVDGDDAVAHVDDRFQSYNIEMVEVTGGRFWKPYEAKAAEHAPGDDGDGDEGAVEGPKKRDEH